MKRESFGLRVLSPLSSRRLLLRSTIEVLFYFIFILTLLDLRYRDFGSHRFSFFVISTHLVSVIVKLSFATADLTLDLNSELTVLGAFIRAIKFIHLPTGCFS